MAKKIKLREDGRMFVSFDLEDGGRVHIPTENIARLWNLDQERQEKPVQKAVVQNMQLRPQYRIIPMPPSLTEEWLNKLGEDGWCMAGQRDSQLIFMRVIAGSGEVCHTDHEGKSIPDGK